MKKYIINLGILLSLGILLLVVFCFSGISGIPKAADDAGTGELLSGSSDVSQASDAAASLEKKKIALTFDGEDIAGPNVTMFSAYCFL